MEEDEESTVIKKEIQSTLKKIDHYLQKIKRELMVVKDIVEEDSLLDTSKLVNDKLIGIARVAKIDISELLELRSKNVNEEEADNDQGSEAGSHVSSTQRTLAQSLRNEWNEEDSHTGN